MKKEIEAILAAVITYLVCMALCLVGMVLDLFFNPWIQQLSELQWWNVFTSSHYSTWLYATGQWYWLIPASIISLIIAALMGVYIYGLE